MIIAETEYPAIPKKNRQPTNVERAVFLKELKLPRNNLGIC
jgi:hypothetical protein